MVKTEFIERGSFSYPEKIERYAHRPGNLYIKGDLSLTEGTCLAVVGSRGCSSYGRAVATRIGRKCGELGITLVSGLARGIDECGMRGALEAGGKVIAVLASGTDVVYPRSNQRLQQQIAEEGLVISEYPDGFKPRRYTFPQRNRIISALSEAVVVVEAGVKSGSLITAECAAEQGKQVFAVPGNITSVMSLGCNRLISEGVMPVAVIDDIFTYMGFSMKGEENICATLGTDERKVFSVVKRYGETTVEEISHITNIKPAIINGIITILEIKGLVFCEIGKICIAKF